MQSFRYPDPKNIEEEEDSSPGRRKRRKAARKWRTAEARQVDEEAGGENRKGLSAGEGAVLQHSIS